MIGETDVKFFKMLDIYFPYQRMISFAVHFLENIWENNVVYNLVLIYPYPFSIEN